MDIYLAAVSPSRARAKSAAASELAEEFLGRASRFAPCTAISHGSEAALLAWVDRQPRRSAAHLILLDSAGEQFSSEQFAAHFAALRDGGKQAVVLAIGPADGWSAAARGRASLLLSLGRMTLPHELARAVVAEQIYRALTILARHPYHCGH